MSAIDTMPFQLPIWFWTGLGTAPRRLARHWAMARLHRRMLKQVATLTDDQLRDLGLEDSPYRAGALRDIRHLEACLSDRWKPHFLLRG